MADEERKGRGGDEKKSETVQVAIRCRPLSSTEVKNANAVIVEIDQSLCQVKVNDPKAAGKGEGDHKAFTFDLVFKAGTPQAFLYDNTCRVIVDSVLQGYNGTIFAYGQTGTGKTYTMEGVIGHETDKGVVPRTFEQLFGAIEVAPPDTKYLVRASFIQIYQDNVLDLLSADSETKHDLRQNPQGGVFVDGVEPKEVQSAADLNKLLTEGKKSRAVSSTNMNSESSRSHCIFQIIVETCIQQKDGQPGPVRMGKLNLVDLAGSERIDKTGAVGQTKAEGIKINQSLTALGNVIAALTSKKKGTHVPYRDSKLTRLLQDSLGGNTRTVMIANIGPADYNFDETISTLRFADRAKNIKNKPKINEDPKDAKMREYQEEIARLKQQLLESEGLTSPTGAAGAAGGGGGGADGVAGGGGGPAPAPMVIVKRKEVLKPISVGVAPEVLLQRQQDLEAKKKKAEEDARLLTGQHREALDAAHAKTRSLEEAVKTQHESLESKRDIRKGLQEELKAMEKKLAVGNRVIDEAKKQAVELERKRAEAARLDLDHKRVERELREKEELQLELKGKHEGVATTLAAKSRKLEKLRAKYQEVKRELEDQQADNQREREELLETIRDLTRNIQLKDMILQNFVPAVEAKKVEARAHWNEETDEWVLAHMSFTALNTGVPRPVSARGVPGQVRPVSELARLKVAMGDTSARWRVDNILDLDLDMPHRTTQDYDAHQLRMEAAARDDDYYNGRGGGGRR